MSDELLAELEKADRRVLRSTDFDTRQIVSMVVPVDVYAWMCARICELDEIRTAVERQS